MPIMLCENKACAHEWEYYGNETTPKCNWCGHGGKPIGKTSFEKMPDGSLKKFSKELSRKLVYDRSLKN